MQNAYRLTSLQALNFARAINRALDDEVSPGSVAISVLVVALALRLEESATDADSLEKLLTLASTHTRTAAIIQFNKRDSKNNDPS